jgi:hypothetical protein
VMRFINILMDLIEYFSLPLFLVYQYQVNYKSE